MDEAIFFIAPIKTQVPNLYQLSHANKAPEMHASWMSIESINQCVHALEATTTANFPSIWTVNFHMGYA